MFEIDRIPPVARQAFFSHGIDISGAELFVRADRDRDFLPCEVYLLANRDKLWILTGVTALKRAERHRLRDPMPESVWQERSFEELSLRELHQFRVEELLSAGRLTAKRGEEGIPVFLAYFTNFCKESIFLFAKYANRLTEGESIEIDPKDRPEEKCCPKCGMRYPDLNRRVCPRCMEKGKLFVRVWSLIRKYRVYLLLILMSLVFLTAMSILVPYLSSGFFYDEVIFGTGEFAGQLLLVLGLIVGTRLLRLFSQMINNWTTSVVAARMVFDLKKMIFASVERLSLRFFTGRQTGGLMTQINEDANTIYEAFCDGIPYFIINIVQVAVLSVLLFLIEPLLACLTLLTVPAFMLLMRWLFRNEKMLHARRYSGSSQMNSFLADVFSGMRVVKAFSREQTEIGRFTERSTRLAASDRKLALFNNYAWPLSGLVLFLGNIIAWGVGGWMVIQGHNGLTYGMLLTFIAYINMIYSPLEFFTRMMNWTADCSNALQRLFEIMDAQPDVSQAINAVTPDILDGRISFERVSFSYQKGRKVIDDVSFSVPDGGILGIVGHTGAGKSTIANLLMRMYDPDEGEIRIGGYPLRELSFTALYRQIAIVSQETYLFIGTIMENIRYARPDADYAEVIEAAKCAGAHEFIMKLPDAYDTRIGFGYQELSGGERQRVSIARAILKNPKILILDEATAAMDTGTERKIQDALTKLIRGKTTVMIAHRLSTLRDADQLVVIEHGKVAESGTHNELLEKENGIYKKLYGLQIEALKNAGIAE